MVSRRLRLDLRVSKAMLSSPLLYTAVCFQDLCASVVSKSCKASGMLTLWTLIRPDFAFMTFVLVTAFSQLLFRSVVVSAWWLSHFFWWWLLPCILGCCVALRSPVTAVWPACVFFPLELVCEKTHACVDLVDWSLCGIVQSKGLGLTVFLQGH